jgi:hypothetical protein
MRQAINRIKELLEECSDQDRRQWQAHAQIVLGAIRTSHPTKRGIQNAIAAAFLDSTAIQGIRQAGWRRQPVGSDADGLPLVITDDQRKARILIATLQLEAGKPQRKSPPPAAGSGWYIAQLPKKQTLPTAGRLIHSARNRAARVLAKTCAYSFMDFDVLAVSIYPITRGPADFRFALSRSLAPCSHHPNLIAQRQAVPAEPSNVWASDLAICLDWHLEATSQRETSGGSSADRC